MIEIRVQKSGLQRLVLLRDPKCICGMGVPPVVTPARRRYHGWVVLAGLSLLAVSSSAWAGEPDKPSPGMLKEMKQIEEQTKAMGSWDSESQMIIDAHNNVFEKNGWNSEADRFSLDLINQVSQIAPWHPHEREEVFFNGIQVRYGLTHDQRTLVAREMRTESVGVAMRHLKEMLPVVMEVVQARAKQEPFTAEQVQKWSKAFEPIMDDMLTSVQRVEQKLRKTMTPEQRDLLDNDMKDVLKRHNDLAKMVKSWQAGNWNPTEWGLDNDPIHAAAMAEYRQKQAERTNLVEAALLKKKPDLGATASDESAWERYVKWFCNYYKCNDQQRGMAKSILESCRKQAMNYLGARRKDMAKAERLSQTAESETSRKFHTAELERLRKPIATIFASLCARLEKQVLTSEQRQMIDGERSKKAQQTANKDRTAKK